MPLNVQSEAIPDSTSMLRVVWKEPIDTNGIIRNYIIFYQQKDAGGEKLNRTVGDITSVILDNLDPYTLYTIWVC